ncbi:putative calcium-transporting atpase 7, plasma membrane-type [Fagus crenata]
MDRLRSCVCLISMLALFLISQARPLVNPNMEGNKKNQSVSMSPPLDKVVPVDLPSPPSPWSNNHEMNTSGDGQSVQGEAVPLDKSPVPPSAPSPITVGEANDIGNHDEMSGGECPYGA